MKHILLCHAPMNAAKTQLMVLNRKCRQKEVEEFTVQHRGECIRSKHEVKYLGVVVDEDLKWKKHVQEVRKKCLIGLSQMRRISQFLPVHTRKSLYNALVLPHIDYCCVLRHDCGATLAQGIERIQNYGMRVITSPPPPPPPRTPSAELRAKLQWTTLTDRRELFQLSTVHRCLHNNAARYMCSKFRTNSSLGYPYTRGYNNIHLEKPNTEYYRKSFKFQEGHQVEWTPRDIKELSSNTAFKIAIKNLQLKT